MALLKRFGVRELFLFVVAVAVLAAAVTPLTDPDFFWHLKVGQWIIDHRAIPTHDLFTYTVPDHRFVAHEWLSEVIMAGLSRGPGFWAGSSLFFGVVTWAAFLVLLATPSRR